MMRSQAREIFYHSHSAVTPTGRSRFGLRLRGLFCSITRAAAGLDQELLAAYYRGSSGSPRR